MLYFSLHGIKLSSRISSFHLESSGASYGALLGKPLRNHDHSRCRENANQELPLRGETRRLRHCALQISAVTRMKHASMSFTHLSSSRRMASLQ